MDMKTEITQAEIKHSEITEIVETCLSLTDTLVAAIEPDDDPHSQPHWAIVRTLQQQLNRLANTL